MNHCTDKVNQAEIEKLQLRLQGVWKGVCALITMLALLVTGCTFYALLTDTSIDWR